MDAVSLDKEFQNFHGDVIGGRIRDLNFLNAGWEGGDVVLHRPGQPPVTLRLGKAGGMGEVLPRFPVEITGRAQSRGLNWRIHCVAPLFTGIMSADVEGQKCTFAQIERDHIVQRQFEDWQFRYGNRNYTVKVWKADGIGPENAASSQYLLEQDELWGGDNIFFAQRPGGKPEPDLYEVPRPDERYPSHESTPWCSSRYAMAHIQRVRYLIFSQAVAKLCLELKCDVLISHDYHVGLAPFFASSPAHPERSNIIQFSVGHNLGYQGVDAFYKPDTSEPNMRCDWRNREELWRYYCDLTGLSNRVLEDYLLAWKKDGEYLGTPNWIQGILRLNYYKTGLAATTVSPNYAHELRTQNRDWVCNHIPPPAEGYRDFSQAECESRLLAYFESNTQQDDLFFPNRNLSDLGKFAIIGVLNGMPIKSHLRCNNQLLAELIVDAATHGKAEEWQHDWQAALTAVGLPTDWLEQAREALGAQSVIPEHRQELRDVLKKTLDETPEEHRMTRWIQTSDHLACIRRLGRHLLFDHKEITDRNAKDSGQPIHFAWGRLVNQKAFHIIKEEIEHITRERRDLLIVLATAPASDIEGMQVENWFREQARGNVNLIFVNRFDAGFRDRCLLAATVAPLTSLYEPCGLTDVEAYWFGTLCAVHNVGGLIKGSKDPEYYTQVRDREPRGDPVAEGYDFYDNTDPLGEARAFRAAYERLVDLYHTDPERFRARQFKALSMVEFTYDIPANRYIDLLQCVWLNQAWRWLKDSQDTRPVDRMREFIYGPANGYFVPGSGKVCQSSLAQLYVETFKPPEGDVGIGLLDQDIKLDRELHRVLSDSLPVAAGNP